MARGPVVNLTFTGNADDAKRAVQSVETSLDSMGDEAARSRRSLDDIDQGAGNTERGLRGLNDGIGGSVAVLGTFGVASGGTVGQIGGMVQGFTDLAGFVGDFAVQIPGLLVKMGLLTTSTVAQTTATGVQTTSQYALNTAFLANPIFLVVAALVALGVAFYVLWQKSETFREIVTGAFNAVRDAAVTAYTWVRDNWPLLLAIITGPFGLAALFIYNNWETIVRFITGIPGRIASALSTLVGILTYPYERAYDVAKWAWERIYDGFMWLKDQLGGVFDGILGAADWLISKVKWLYDNIPGIPSIPGGGAARRLGGFLGIGAEGAIVSQPTLALIGEAGTEAVIPLDRMPGARGLGAGGGGDTYIINAASLDPAAGARMVQAALLEVKRRNGGRF